MELHPHLLPIGPAGSFRTTLGVTLNATLIVVLIAGASMAAPSARAQTTWYVDDDAPGDPFPGTPEISDPNEDGSVDHPFDAIQEGIDAAVDGDQVLVLDGTYRLRGNVDLDFHRKAITVRSENGADTCIIDCSYAGARGFYFHSGETADAVVDGFTITNAWTTDNGGGICCEDSSPTITNCTITSNRAVQGGGVYLSDSNATITHCEFSANETSAWGGGVMVTWRDLSGGAVSITDCTISGNFGDGISSDLDIGGTLTISDCAITENRGSGVHAWGIGTLTIRNCTIAGNETGAQGGGVYCRYHVNLTITDCTIADNTAFAGGGVYCTELVEPTIINCTITGNQAGEGGGVYCGEGTQTLVNCTIAENQATAGGGGAFLRDSDNVTVTGCTIVGNQASYEGGGVQLWSSDNVTVTGCTIAGNTTDSDGGGIYCLNASGSISNSLISGNAAGAGDWGSGGGIYWYSGRLKIGNCTFVANSAGRGGGLSGSMVACAQLDDCILWHNSAEIGPQAALFDWGSKLRISYSDVDGGEVGVYVHDDSVQEWGPGNTDADPLFVDPDGPDGDPDTWDDNDLHLAAGSPCIDAACNCAVPLDTLDLDDDGDTAEYTPFDLDGEGRFFDDPATPDSGSGLPPIVDMGAYEFGDSDTQPCRGDLDGDRDVDTADLAILLANYRTMSGADGADGDMDCDGDIELSDLAALLGVYGAVCD